MANYAIGDMVFESRMARRYSQEELSFGICSTSSLSRIENSGQIPGRKIFEALMQRLGISDSLYSAYISKDEMEICKMIQELAWSLERLEFIKSEKIIEKLEPMLGRNSNLEKQYISFAKANIFLYKTSDHERFFEMLLETIRMTMGDFEPGKGIERRLLTFHEITILDNIAIELYNGGKKEDGLHLLYELKKYMETHIIDEDEKARKYPLILYNLTMMLGNIGKHEDVYKLCDQGIIYCVEHNKLIYLPYLLTNMASAAAEQNMVEKAKELFGQAYIMFKICRKPTLAEDVRLNAFSLYEIELT